MRAAVHRFGCASAAGHDVTGTPQRSCTSRRSQRRLNESAERRLLRAWWADSAGTNNLVRCQGAGRQAQLSFGCPDEKLLNGGIVQA